MCSPYHTRRVSAQSHGLKCERLSTKRPVSVDVALIVLECMDAALVQAKIPLTRNPEDMRQRRALDIEYLYRALAEQVKHSPTAYISVCIGICSKL